MSLNFLFPSAMLHTQPKNKEELNEMYELNSFLVNLQEM
jgi:hypothetical protein